MIDVNKIYKTKEILSFVDDLVWDTKGGYFSYVSFSDKLCFAGMLAEAQKQNDCSDWMECFLNDGIENLFINRFKKQTVASASDLIVRVEKSLVSHFENVMEEIFNERISEYEESIRDRSMED